MSHDLAELLSALEACERLYTRLLQSCERKRDALVAYRPAKVEEITMEEGALLAAISRCDVQRALLLRALLPDAEHPTLTALIEKCEDDAVCATLAGIREHLRTLAMQVGRVNRLNSQLCGQALSHLNGFLEAIAGAGKEQGTYNKDGDARGFTGRALVDQSA